MNREYNSRVSSKNSERLLKNLKNTTGVYFFLPHPVEKQLQQSLQYGGPKHEKVQQRLLRLVSYTAQVKIA